MFALNVNPFDEPDVQENRGRVSSVLEVLSAKRQLPSRTARVREKGMELYAEGETRLQISTLNLSEAFRTFLEAREADGYLAIITFAGSQPARTPRSGACVNNSRHACKYRFC